MKANYHNNHPSIKAPSQGQHKKILEKRILIALRHVAQAVQEDDRILPVFIRLENDLNEIRKDLEAIERAKSYSISLH